MEFDRYSKAQIEVSTDPWELRRSARMLSSTISLSFLPVSLPFSLYFHSMQKFTQQEVGFCQGKAVKHLFEICLFLTLFISLSFILSCVKDFLFFFLQIHLCALRVTIPFSLPQISETLVLTSFSQLLVSLASAGGLFGLSQMWAALFPSSLSSLRTLFLPLPCPSPLPQGYHCVVKWHRHRGLVRQ